MRPVYFPAILSPCYGLPLCNYILIPPTARVPRLLLFASFSFRLLPSTPHLCLHSSSLLVIFINLRVPSLSLPPVVFLITLPVPSRILEHRQASTTFASLWRQGALFIPSGDIVTYPRLVAHPPLRFPRGMLVPRIELRLGVNKKAAPPRREFVLHLLYSGARSIGRHFGIRT